LIIVIGDIFYEKTAFVFVAYYEKVAAIISLNEFLNKYFNRKFAVFLGQDLS